MCTAWGATNLNFSNTRDGESLKYLRSASVGWGCVPSTSVGAKSNNQLKNDVSPFLPSGSTTSTAFRKLNSALSKAFAVHEEVG